ncbi:MAG: Rieske (2Fe-2S) protein [Nocardioidaceae bacterium]
MLAVPHLPDHSTADHSTADHGVDRRSLLRGAAALGGVAVASAVVAGCGSAGSTSGSAGSNSGGGGSSSGDLAAASSIPVGGGTIFASQQVVVTQPTAGEFKGFSAVCTHQGCLVSTVSQGSIICPCHNTHYSIKDGSVQSGPAPSPLPPEPVRVRKGQVALG